MGACCCYKYLGDKDALVKKHDVKREIIINSTEDAESVKV